MLKKQRKAKIIKYFLTAFIMMLALSENVFAVTESECKKNYACYFGGDPNFDWVYNCICTTTAKTFSDCKKKLKKYGFTYVEYASKDGDGECRYVAADKETLNKLQDIIQPHCYVSKDGVYYYGLKLPGAEYVDDSNEDDCKGKNIACYVTEDGVYVRGPYNNKPGYTYVDDSKLVECIMKGIDFENKIENKDDLRAVDEETKQEEEQNANLPDEEKEDAIVHNYYKVTYDLAGGKFIDGSTTRTEVVRDDKQVGMMKTFPVKDGYKFSYWELNDSKFDFTKSVTSNVTLKAVWEEYKIPENLYCEKSTAIYEPYKNICYDVLKDNDKPTNTTIQYASSMDDAETSETISNTSGVRWCYKPTSASGAVHFIKQSDGSYTKGGYLGSGKNNKDYDQLYGYSENDTWLSEDTCLIASPCTENGNLETSSCTRSWSAIIYNMAEPIYIEEEIPENNDDSGKTDKTDNEIDDPGKTGDALIIGAWVVAVGALGYSVYYFKKRKANI